MSVQPLKALHSTPFPGRKSRDRRVFHTPELSHFRLHTPVSLITHTKPFDVRKYSRRRRARRPTRDWDQHRHASSTPLVSSLYSRFFHHTDGRSIPPQPAPNQTSHGATSFGDSSALL